MSALPDLSIRTRLDTTQADAEAAALGARVDQQVAVGRAQLLKLAAIASVTFNAFFGGINQTYALAIQLGVNLLRFQQQVAVASLAGGFLGNPVLAAQAIASLIAIAALGNAIIQLEAGATEAANQSAQIGNFFTAVAIW